MKIKKWVKSVVKEHINYTLTTQIGSRKFTIPIRNGIGLGNLNLNNDWFYNLISKINLPKGSVFVDVGVNIGQTILKFRSCHENKYIGFEPNSSCVNYSTNLVKVNKLTGISIVPVGLSLKDEVVTILLRSDCDSGATIVNNLRPGFYKNEEKMFIPVFKFDNLKVVEPTEKIYCVKIDVEGAELEVISGMLDSIKGHRPIIICEILDYHDKTVAESLQNRANKLFDLLNGCNYKVYKIDHSNNNLKFEELTKIELVQWTDSSNDLNDYIFLPNEKSLDSVID